MALFSFGKKKEKVTEVVAPVEKAPPNAAPKIQNPPTTTAFPAIKPPQATGLMPATPLPPGTAMTQPMAGARMTAPGLKPARANTGQTRSTQRIVLPTPPGGRTPTKSLAGAAGGGKISLPVGMVLRSLPPEALAGNVADFEQNGAAATEMELPMNVILGQLPSGKIEMTMQELVPLIPAGFLQPASALSNLMGTVVNLPLMDIVMRIPPDLLALRPDQKDVDASVINMADPFTEEILREQAETARRQSGANIIEESQAPQEEFVPSSGAPTTSIVPPRRPNVEPLVPSRIAATTLAAPSVPQSRSPQGTGAALRPPGAPLPPAATNPIPLPLGPRTPTGQIPTPVRMSTPLPPRQPVATAASAATSPAGSTAPVPPVPRQTGPIPAPPPPRHTTSLPPAARRSGTLTSLSQSLSGAAMAAAAAEAASVTGTSVPANDPPSAPSEGAEAPAPETTGVAVQPGAPDAAADDLQRLAALAMAQLGDASETAPGVPSVTENDRNDAPPAAAETESETAPEAGAEAEPESRATEEAGESASPAEATPASEPSPAPEPEEEESFIVPPTGHVPVGEPISATSVHEPIRAPAPEAVTGSTPATPVRATSSGPVRIASTPEPIRAPAAEVPSAPLPVQEPIRAPAASPQVTPGSAESPVAFNLNTCTADDLVSHVAECSPALAAAIIAHREKIGSYARLEDLLEVPGMTKTAYRSLTGESPAENRGPLSLNELLGFPLEQKLSLKDVTERINCWPDVTGCLLSQSSGLSLVGSAPEGFDQEAIVAFAPRMFEAINKSFAEVSGDGTDALIIPTAGTSFHLFRSKDLYLIIMSRLPLMPERHVKVARYVLAELSHRRE